MSTSHPPAGPRHAALRRGRVSLSQQVYHVTISTHSRLPVFKNHRAAVAAARCFHDAELLGDARMRAWVLMPDHTHWLLQLGNRDTLSIVVARLKSASARKVNRAIGHTGCLWATAYHDHALRREEDVATMTRYIIENPLRAGLVEHIGDYPFWDSTWL